MAAISRVAEEIRALTATVGRVVDLEASKEIGEQLRSVERRLTTVENRQIRVVWTAAGAVAVIQFVLWLLSRAGKSLF